MATTFLSLTNEVCRKVNEVELTSSNFATATGFYSAAKDGVNRAIDEINVRERYWRFNFNSEDQTLVAGTMRYAYPATAKTIDFDSFRIQEDAALNNQTVFLKRVPYPEYLKTNSWREYDTDTGQRSTPRFIVELPTTQYLVFPSPDAAYTLTFDYYQHNSRLSAHDDTMNLPDQFRHVVFVGAMRDAYEFRNDYENQTKMEKLFEELIVDMRTTEININYQEFRSKVFNKLYTHSGYGTYAEKIEFP